MNPYSDPQTPTAAERAFYSAFQALDGERMSRVWAPSKDVCCVHPGGPLFQGPAAVLESWLEIFRGAEPPQLEYALLQSRQAEGIAVHLVEERIRPRAAGANEAAVVLATNVYVLASGGWRIFSHHASLSRPRRAVLGATGTMH